MKKIIVIGLILVMLTTVIAGCGTSDTSDPTTAPGSQPIDDPVLIPVLRQGFL